jgi:hypothetical protein
MIWESYYWKESLLKHAGDLRKRKTQKRWREASFGRVEETVMLAFYSIRKLIEAAKIATATSKMEIAVELYPWKGKRVTRLNWHKLDELYDSDSRITARIPLQRICNQMGHSYVFAIAHSDSGGLGGFLFVSDRDKHRHLHFLDVDEAIAVFEHVGRDYPNEVRMALNSETGDYEVTAITHREGELANKAMQTDGPSGRR